MPSSINSLINKYIDKIIWQNGRLWGCHGNVIKNTNSDKPLKSEKWKLLENILMTII